MAGFWGAGLEVLSRRRAVESSIALVMVASPVWTFPHSLFDCAPAECNYLQPPAVGRTALARHLRCGRRRLRARGFVVSHPHAGNKRKDGALGKSGEHELHFLEVREKREESGPDAEYNGSGHRIQLAEPLLPGRVSHPVDCWRKSNCRIGGDTSRVRKRERPPNKPQDQRTAGSNEPHHSPEWRTHSASMVSPSAQSSKPSSFLTMRKSKYQ